MTVIARPALAPRTSAPLATALRLADARDVWAPHVDFDPSARYYRRLLATDDHEAWLLTWLPGQGTPWHDHGGSAGAFVVLQGTLTERVARHGLVRGGRHVHDRGSAHAFGSRYVHRVTNEGSDPAVSLHVYAPRLTSMTDYAEHDGVLAPVGSRTEEAW